MKVFISHSHQDKRVARRVRRYLAARNVESWLDERELRPGAALSASLRRHIEEADFVIVVATRASAASRWVGMELDHASKRGKAVVPLLLEDVAQDARFADHVGLDARSPQAFSKALETLARELFHSLDEPFPGADRKKLEDGLRQLAEQESDVAPLILGCLDGHGLHQESMETVYRAPFHAVDEAHEALFDVRPDENMATHLAYGFAYAGAGAWALSRWITATDHGGGPLVIAMGSSRLAPALFDTALRLLGQCNPPNNHALYQFIHVHGAKLTKEQQREAVRLTVHPVREGIANLADVLAYVAYRQFPEASEIRLTWTRWIQSGAFDDGEGARLLAHHRSEASRDGLPGWEGIDDALRQHVRTLLRSADGQEVLAACAHIRQAADKATPVLGALLGEAHGVSGTAEWDEWRRRDPDAAERAEWVVHFVCAEARSERDWLRADEEARRMVEFDRGRRRTRDGGG